MRLKRGSPWTFIALLAFLPTLAAAQSENAGAALPQIPGRRELKGTLTKTASSKNFSEHFAPGLYRLTYLSDRAPAVMQVSAGGHTMGLSAPTQPFAMVLNERTGRSIELEPTGLCSSDVAPQETCAVEKLHFRLAQEQTLTIKVEGNAHSPGSFRILVDPLKETPKARGLPIDGMVTDYLAFMSDSAAEGPHAEFGVQLSNGQRLGVLLGSPDFTTMLEVRDPTGALVASSSDFNLFLDPCREVRIDRLPKFDPLSQSDAYVTFQSGEAGTYTVRVIPRYRGETGLYVLRSFDLTDPRINPGQMRSGYLEGAKSLEFLVNLPPTWQSQGSQITAYSPLPISVQLADEDGQLLADSVEGKASEFESGLQPQNLGMLHWTSINLDSVDVAKLGKARIRVKAEGQISDQFFLVGFATRWGACGGGAVQPISVFYPAPSDFTDQGYPINTPKMPVAQLEAVLYSTARSTLRWYFLLEAADGGDKDPETLVSSYARYVPDHVSLSAWLVEFQVAIRVQFSAKSGAARLWTRVERHGYKEKTWQLDSTETAKAQQLLAYKIQQALRVGPK